MFITRTAPAAIAALLPLIANADPRFNLANQPEAGDMEFISPTAKNQRSDALNAMLGSFVAHPALESNRDADIKAILGGTLGTYCAMFDEITMPSEGVFPYADIYLAVMFHEMGHSTGHKFRLNRIGVMNVTDQTTAEYWKEEITAALVSIALTAHLKNITPAVRTFHEDMLEQYVGGAVNAGFGDVLQEAIADAIAATDYIVEAHPLSVQHREAGELSPREKMSAYMEAEGITLPEVIRRWELVTLTPPILEALADMEKAQETCDCTNCRRRRGEFVSNEDEQREEGDEADYSLEMLINMLA